MTQSRRQSILMVARGLDPVGTGRQVELAAEAFRAAGHDIRIAITTGGGSSPERLASRGFAVHCLSRRPRLATLAGWQLARLARDTRPDAILTWGRGQAMVAALFRRLFPGARLVCHVGVAPRRRIDGWALRAADRVVTPTPAVASACGRAGVLATDIDIVAPGIEPVAGTGMSRAQLAARLGLREDSVWTLCVAPLEPAAHIERLLWAIDQLGVVNRGLEHVLVGAGPLLARIRRRARLQDFAERLFVFPGLECLPDLLQRVRLVWQPGDVACGGCLLDGMAHGVAAVAVESDAAGQLISDGTCGRIVAADPISDFPRRALGIIEDDLLAARYGSAARTRAVEEFPVARSTAALLAAVERAVAGKP